MTVAMPTGPAHLPLFLSESMSRPQARARQWCKFMALGPRATGKKEGEDGGECGNGGGRRRLCGN